MSGKSQNRQFPAHELLGRLLQEILGPVQVTVQTNVRIMAESPEADILLIRRDGPHWTEAQRNLLPDGIRETAADHVLIEFKFTQSLSREALYQGTGYRHFYLRAQELSTDRLQAVIVSAKTPCGHFRKTFGYASTDTPGVLRSSNPMLDILPVLVLNELSDAPHNLYVKCFASRRKVRMRAFQKLFALFWKMCSQTTRTLLLGMFNILFPQSGGQIMSTIEWTPEQVMELGKAFEDNYLASLPVEKRMEGLDPATILSRFNPEDRLAGLKPEDRLAGLKPEDRLAGLKPEDVLAHFGLEEILRSLEPYLKKESS
jgi:hypothetical protein